MWQLLKAPWSISHVDTARGGVWGQSSTLSELNWGFQTTLVPWHLSKAFTLINMDLPLDKLSLGAEYQLIKKHFIFTHLQTKGIPWSGFYRDAKRGFVENQKVASSSCKGFFSVRCLTIPEYSHFCVFSLLQTDMQMKYGAWSKSLASKCYFNSYWTDSRHPKVDLIKFKSI